MSNSNITIKSLDEVAPFGVPTTAPKSIKQSIVANYLDQRKYEFVGFIDRTNDIVLRNRFHSVRDEFGRFASAN